MVGLFDCVGPAVSAMVDIAIDRAGKMTGSAAISFNNALGGALVSIDPTSAHCTVLTHGPNLVTSLTYVPEGRWSPTPRRWSGTRTIATCASIPRRAS